MILMERGLRADTYSEIMRLNNNAEGGNRSEVIERMIQQFGLNYTNSAMLYDQWAAKTENGTKSMSIEDAQELIDTYGKTPPPPNSPEFDAEKMKAVINGWWTQTGISKWDKNFPRTLAEELAKAIREYNKETGSSVPIPGEKPVIPITDDMTPKERYDAIEQNIKILSERGDYAGMERAVADLRRAEMDLLRQNQEMDMKIDQARSAVKGKTGMMYDEAFGSKEDKEAHRNVNSVFGAALSSEDSGEREAAMNFSQILRSMTETEKGAIDKYNKNGIWNELGKETDIRGLISALDRLTSTMDDITIKYEEE
jgi:hypothetical protein